MSRLRRIELAGRYFLVTTNLLRSVPRLTADERAVCLECLDKSRAKHGFSLFAYVGMPDHVHLLLRPWGSSLPDLMGDWKNKCAVAVANKRRTRGPIWQKRYFDFILRRASDFGDKLGYIHENPVAAGLVARPEDWPWSSAAFYLKKTPVLLRPEVFSVPVDPNEPLWPVPWR
jgi:REP element-mobilizing transposase RayT